MFDGFQVGKYTRPTDGMGYKDHMMFFNHNPLNFYHLKSTKSSMLAKTSLLNQPTPSTFNTQMLPDAPCMEYLPTSKGEKWPHSQRETAWQLFPTYMEHLG